MQAYTSTIEEVGTSSQHNCWQALTRAAHLHCRLSDSQNRQKFRWFYAIGKTADIMRHFLIFWSFFVWNKWLRLWLVRDKWRYINVLWLIDWSNYNERLADAIQTGPWKKMQRLEIKTHYHKSPAVARVSRPYSWCTLATCVHNCPSMMFRTCCCLRPKCKRSYLFIYITSDTS